MAGYSGGVYTRVHRWVDDRLANINITDTRMDEEDDSIADALSRCILKDGTQTITADIPMNGHNISGLPHATLPDQAVSLSLGDARYVKAGADGGSMTGALTITSSHFAALAVGPTGQTDATFQVACNNADAKTGLLVSGQPAGQGIYLAPLSPGANESMIIAAKGTGNITLSTAGLIDMVSGGALQAPAMDGGFGTDFTGSLTVRNKTASGVGDTALAAMTFYCQGRWAVKLALRADGIFGVGGYSTTPWCWYVNTATGAMIAEGPITTAAHFIAAGTGQVGGSLTVVGANPTITLNDTTWGLRGLGHSDGTVIFTAHSGTPTMYHDNNGTTTFTGNVTAYSDERLKTGIETIQNALWRVRQMRGVRFYRIDTDQPSAGVIAQELQPIAPELVDGRREYMSVAYGNLVAYLIEAVKELADRMDREERYG